MKYVSIDIETTGLDTEKCQVLSIGAIIEDTEKQLSYEDSPKFNVIVLQRHIAGSPYAINMNKHIIEIMSQHLDGKVVDPPEGDTTEYYTCLEADEVAKAFFDFCWENGLGKELSMTDHVRVIDGKTYPAINGKTKPIVINVAGKNFKTFDNLFLNKLLWWKKLIIARQRVIDPAPLYCDWLNDETLPSLTECKQRAGVKGIVTHNALEDAWDVIEVLRKKY